MNLKLILWVRVKIVVIWILAKTIKVYNNRDEWLLIYILHKEKRLWLEIVGEKYKVFTFSFRMFLIWVAKDRVKGFHYLSVD